MNPSKGLVSRGQVNVRAGGYLHAANGDITQHSRWGLQPTPRGGWASVHGGGPGRLPQVVAEALPSSPCKMWAPSPMTGRLQAARSEKSPSDLGREQCVHPPGLALRRAGSLAGAPHPVPHSWAACLPRTDPAGQWCTRNGGGGCSRWHKAQQRGTPSTESFWAPTDTHQQGRQHSLGPARSKELSTACARLLGLPLGLRHHGHRKGPDIVVACLIFPSLLNDFQDVITIKGDALERRGALKA